MAVLLQMDFSFAGPFGAALTEAMTEMARSINREPGFLWKIWTENEAEQSAGGVYLFASEAAANAYLEKHAARLRQFGINRIRSRLFAVNEGLSAINHAPPM